jgi:glycosyltransferase involved in cell wall biosynthesis
MATFIGPVALSGIGQVMRKYAWLTGGEYVEYGQQFKGGSMIAFVLPVRPIVDLLKQYQKQASKVTFLTICETETVHEDYQMLFELGDTFWVASEYCSTILKRQFPQGNFPVLKLYAFPPGPATPIKQLPDLTGKYVFYHIGNVIDPRKNTKTLIECFLRAQIPNSVLLLKATCNQPVPWKVPGVIVIEGLLSEQELEWIHRVGHCYVSMAHSEGAGMGAIEAAMRHKPVIVPEYGATKEYVDAFLVPCKPAEVPNDDFLFKKGMMWSDPDPEIMIELMKRIAKNGPMKIAHTKTYLTMAEVPHNLLEIIG